MVTTEDVIKYKDKPGFIKSSRVLKRNKYYLEINVADTGIGISKGDLQRLFNEFEQIDSTLARTRQEEGTGLGLALVKKLAELHGGTVAVQSEPAKGSCFTIWLPYNKAKT